MGNPESYLGRTLSWEGKQLTSVTDGTHSYFYSYNEDGLRLRKVVDGTDTEYYYNGSVLMYMITGSGSTAIQQRFSYDAAGNLVAVVYKVGSGTSYIYYYLRNAQGDIVKLIDSSGNTVVEYLYDSWGKIIATTGSLANTVGANQPFRYRGYVYDNETGWYYLQSRYYDPTTCRFISADVLLSTGQGVIGHNSFAYCLNNPVIRVDVDGGLGLLIGGLIAIGVAVVSGLITGGFEAAQGGSFGEGFVVGFTGTIVAEALTAVSIATFGATTAPAIMACSAVSAGFGSVASYGVNCAFKEETFDFGDAAMSFGIGAAVNVVGGVCMGAFINSATNSVIENVISSGVSSLASDCIGEGFDLLEKSISYRKERELAKKTRERAKQRRLSRMNRKMRRVRHAKFTRCNIAPHAFYQMRPYNQIF